MKHINLEERSVVAHLLGQGKSVREIARQLGRSASTISREISRNGSKTTDYKAATAQTRYGSRLRKRQQQRRKIDQTRLSCLCDVIDYTLLTVAQAMRLFAGSAWGMSRSRIYTMIREDKKAGGNLWKCLSFSAPVQRHFPSKSSRTKWEDARKRIEDRPEVVDLLEEYGHWEVDTIHSKGHRGGVVTLVERTTLRLKAAQIADLKANTVTEMIVELMRGETCKTITSDNGSEFANWKQVEAALGCGFYFGRPYRSNDRARNERMNREIRRFFPKGTDFEEVEASWFDHVIDRLNAVPREKFGWRSSNQMAQRMAA